MNGINIKKLNFSFTEKKILDELNLDIEKGGFFSIIGPNGAGKSTLIKNIMRFYDIKDKTIFISGEDINKKSRKNLAESLAYVSQDLIRKNKIPIFDFILSGRYAKLGPWENYGESDFEDVEEILYRLGLSKYKNNNIMELSGGEFQRVMIARAIVQGADYLLMDEPVSNLDIHYQLEIMELLKKLSKKKYFTVVTVLHDINLASQYSDQIILMDNGKIIEKGSPNDILNKEIISKLYKINCEIIKHPNTGKPYILPYTY